MWNAKLLLYRPKTQPSGAAQDSQEPTPTPPQGDECLVQVFKSLNSPRHDKDIPFQTPFKGNVARHCQGHVSIPPSLKPRREIWLRADQTGCFSLRPGVSRFRHEENE